jgi:hypothetical protein
MNRPRFKERARSVGVRLSLATLSDLENEARDDGRSVADVARRRVIRGLSRAFQ